MGTHSRTTYTHAPLTLALTPPTPIPHTYSLPHHTHSLTPHTLINASLRLTRARRTHHAHHAPPTLTHAPHTHHACINTSPTLTPSCTATHTHSHTTHTPHAPSIFTNTS